MHYVADLHVHSHFSRATSSLMDVEHLYAGAQRKGLTVVGTGDFTHPRWFAELQEKLEPAEPGLFKLKDGYGAALAADVPEACRAPVRFILSAEISTIYKKADRTRKVHSLILAPDFCAAGRLNAGLQNVGNITSDGRPILGMDCKTLLQFTLEASPDNIFIPAHIWTPHFSVLGAASGFDSIEECFEELTPQIFALETGLSSDPPMNWMLSSLDRFVLVSNSDAHSPMKLAREANVFNCELSYFAMRDALREHDPARFKGTIEFFPEQGKYHYDGHRTCNVRMAPQETQSHRGTCPRCGKKVTIGVMHRVTELADRRHGFRPACAFGFENLVPLEDLLAEVHGVGAASKRIVREYSKLLARFGSELYLLRDLPLADLAKAGYQDLAEALRKTRERRIWINPGYDGAYGTVHVFEPGDRPARQLSFL